MTRESAAVKSARYLTEGRLIVSAVDGQRVTATCRGDGAVHHLGHDLGRGWHCDCPARSAGCAHLIALKSVTVVRRSP